MKFSKATRMPAKRQIFRNSFILPVDLGNDALAGSGDGELLRFVGRHGGRIAPELIAREIAQAIRKSRLLEVIEPAVTMESVGGLDLLKAWILKRRNSFTVRAREFGLPMPKGVLIIGVPGTGKSLAAKVTAKVLGVPLLTGAFGNRRGSRPSFGVFDLNGWAF